MSDLDLLFQEHCNKPGDINEHLPVLKELASCCNSVTEFGIRHGTSSVGLLAGLPSRYRGVDVNEPGAIFAKAAELARHQGVNISVRIGSTLEIPEIDETDLLFVDTVHTYDQVTGELTRHAHRVRRFLVFHDTVSHPEVFRAVESFMASSPEWALEFNVRNNNGLAMLKRTNP